VVRPWPDPTIGFDPTEPEILMLFIEYPY